MTQDARQLERQAQLSQEVLISWWRDWVTYLETRIAMLDLPTDAPSGALFDHDTDSHAESAQRLRETLGRMPPDRRTVFERVTTAVLATRRRAYEESRRATPHALANLEAATLQLTDLDRASLTEELSAARGDVATGRMAVVPTSLDADGWYELPPSVLAQVPPSVAYRPERARGRFSSEMIGAGLLMLVLIVGVVWLVFPSDPSQALPDTASVAQILVGTEPVAAWALAGIRRDGGDLMPITSVAPAAWPPTALTAGAAVREASMAPRIICLAGESALPTTLDLLGRGADPSLTVRVSAAIDPMAPVRIERCADGQPIGSGTVDLILPPVASMGETHAVGQMPAVQLEQIRVRDDQTGSSVASGMVDVTVIVSSAAGVDWYAVFPTIRFADGSAQPHTRIETEVNGTTQIVYEFAARGRSESVRWQITDPATGMTGMWDVSLPVPPTRDAWLTDQMTWQVTESIWQTNAAMPELATLALTLVISPTGDTPLALQPADVVAFQADQPLGPVVFPADQSAMSLTPATPTTISVTLLADPRTPVQVYLGLNGAVIPAHHEGGS